MSTTAVPNNSMRQQLDELDSLLQRMLALPINQLEERPPPRRRHRRRRDRPCRSRR